MKCHLCHMGVHDVSTTSLCDICMEAVGRAIEAYTLMPVRFDALLHTAALARQLDHDNAPYEVVVTGEGTYIIGL